MNLLECEEETGGESRGEPLAAVKIQMRKTESWNAKEDSRNICRVQVLPHSWTLTLLEP